VTSPTIMPGEPKNCAQPSVAHSYYDNNNLTPRNRGRSTTSRVRAGGEGCWDLSLRFPAVLWLLRALGVPVGFVALGLVISADLRSDGRAGGYAELCEDICEVALDGLLA